MAATSVGQIGLDLVVNQNQFQKQMSGITSLAKKAGAALAAAFAVKKIVQFGKECTELGSDLAEVQNVVDVTFPSMTAQVDKFAKSAAASFGLSETMAKKYTGTFGAMAKAFGFTESAAFDMGSTLTGLAGDVASFYNISQDEAYTKLKSVFTGETETLKDLGVVMTQNALDAYAMANGIGKTTQQMTEAEKVALRYKFVQEQLTAATGDFARTSGSWANQIRLMKLQFDSLKATIGQGLINLFTPVIRVINTLLGKLTTLANAFKSFTELITGNKSSGSSTVANPVSDLADTAGDASAGLSDASGAADSLADNTSGVGKAAKKAAKEMKALMGFDQVNKLAEPVDDSDSGDAGSSIPSGGNTGGISTGPGAGLGDAVSFGNLAEGETVVDKLGSKFAKFFENIKNGVQPTVDALKRLWNEGLAKLGDFAWTALKDFYNGFLVPVGKWVFGEGIPRFIDALNNGLMKVDFQKINDALKGLWDVLTPFAINVGEGLLWFWENVLVPLGTWVANEVVPRFLETLTKAIDAVNKIIEALKPLFEWFWENVLKPLAEWTGGIFLSIWDKINEALGKFADWCSEHQTAIQNIAVVIASFFAAWKIASFISTAAGFIKTAVNIFSSIKSVAGVFSLLKTGIGAVVSALGGPLTIALTAIIAIGVLVWKNWDTIKAKAIEIWGAIRDWFEKTVEAIKGFFSGLWKGIKETFASVGGWFREKFTVAWTNVKGAFSKAVGFFKSVWSGIKGVFGNITGWFKDKFSAAWQAVKNVFSSGGEIFNGIKEGILDGLKAVVNALIDGINTVVSIPFEGINWALDGIRGVSIAGFEPFSWLPTISTPQIPHLAQGGYVKPNTPQLAMIGDNRHQGEVVAPEGKMLEMARMAAEMSGAGSAEILILLKEILEFLKRINPVDIDEEALRKYFIVKTNRNTKSSGKCELLT